MKRTILILALAAGYGCGRDTTEAPRQAAWNPPAGSLAVTVRVEQVSPRIDIIGTVKSRQEVALSARLPGTVVSVNANAGDPVTNGQILVVLDDRDLAEQLSAAEAQLKQAASERERTRRLFDQNASTDQALIAAATAFDSARAQVERLRIQLTYTQIASPIDGVLIDRKVEAGDFASQGQVIANLYDPARLRLEVPVPVRLTHRLALGQEVDLTLDPGEKAFKGTVAEMVGAIDPATRSRTVKIDLATGDAAVVPGAFGRLWVEGDARPALRIPAAALLRVGQLVMVNVVRSGSTTRRIVTIGPEEGDVVEILSGLVEGDVVVVPAAGGT